VYCNTSYVLFQWAACQQIGMLEVFSWLRCYNGTLWIRNCPFPFRKYRQTCRANWHAEVYKQEISGGVRFLYQNIYRTDWLEVARQFCRKPGTSFTFHAQISWNFGATIPKRRSSQFLFTIIKPASEIPPENHGALTQPSICSCVSQKESFHVYPLLKYNPVAFEIGFWLMNS